MSVYLFIFSCSLHVFSIHLIACTLVRRLFQENWSGVKSSQALSNEHKQSNAKSWLILRRHGGCGDTASLSFCQCVDEQRSAANTQFRKWSLLFIHICHHESRYTLCHVLPMPNMKIYCFEYLIEIEWFLMIQFISSTHTHITRWSVFIFYSFERIWKRDAAAIEYCALKLPDQAYFCVECKRNKENIAHFRFIRYSTMEKKCASTLSMGGLSHIIMGSGTGLSIKAK